MFTIKANFNGGHAVYECASYRYRQPGAIISGFIADPVNPSLDMFDTAGDLLGSLTLTEGTCYVMNAAGKTIDTMHGPGLAGSS